jgi:hypothetical protein
MSIPLDRLYHYIENIAENLYGDILIYRFFPHGSKNLKDMSPLHCTNFLLPAMICHDQEPLFYDFYQQQLKDLPRDNFQLVLESIPHNSNRYHNLKIYSDVHNLTFLLHSEKRSCEVKKYQENNFIPVYYWSHALIARDWFRFAQHVEFKKNTKQTFLIYNRAWSGTREYRLKFLELLIESNLQNHCKTTLNAIEPELNIHYESHMFDNSAWKPKCKLENYFVPTPTDSCASADFDLNDYNQTEIEIVLETLFDDRRLHLTEKSIRPIACGQPFILAATSGSLGYLHSYGFKTFGDIWDESYDKIADPEKRLQSIIGLMKSIQAWSPQTKAKKLAQAQSVANHNKKHFFSDKFFNQIIKELKQNIKSAVQIFDQHNAYDRWLDRWNHLMQYPQVREFLKTNTDGPFLNFDVITTTIDQLTNAKSKKLSTQLK